ncbi:MAG TPA: hypothetical protein VMS17_24895 [Gemmataceae bacterium]|nr:hypothetical protein [Gemmataceae bacterium]
MSQAPPAVPTASAAAPAPTYRRHAWGWPAGSVRAILALGVLALLWIVALFHPAGESLKDAQHHLPVFLISLQVLMVLILAHYFTAHGKTIGRHVSGAHPLHVPGGVIRFVLAGGYIGLCVLLFKDQADFQLPKDTSLQWLLIQIAAVLVAYFVGLLITRGVHLLWGDPPPAPYQDIEAWVALLAMVGLGVIVMIHLMNQSVSTQNQIPLDGTQAVVSGLIGLYFGARS